jgi:hypothetical protein
MSLMNPYLHELRNEVADCIAHLRTQLVQVVEQLRREVYEMGDLDILHAQLIVDPAYAWDIVGSNEAGVISIRAYVLEPNGNDELPAEVRIRNNDDMEDPAVVDTVLEELENSMLEKLANIFL